MESKYTKNTLKNRTLIFGIENGPQPPLWNLKKTHPILFEKVCDIASLKLLMKLDEKFLSCYTKRWPRVKKFKKTLPKYFNNKKRRKLFKVRQYYAKFKKTGDPRTAKIERAEFCEIMQVLDKILR